MTKKFTGQETISDILFELPEANEILASHGLSCTSCHLNQYEILREGIKTHGYTDDDVDRVLADLNEALEDSTSHKKVLLPPIITEKALEIIKKLQQEQLPEGGLKIEAEIIEGEPDYFLDFLKISEEGDKTFHLENIKLFIDPESLKLLQGITIDYKKQENQEGFVFNTD